MRPRNDGHLAITVHAHHGAFPAAVQGAPLREIGARPGAGLVDEGSEPDSHQNSVRAQACLFASERGIVGQRQQPLQQRRRIAGIVDASSRCRIGKFGPRDEVALPHLDHVDVELPRAKLDEALVDPRRLGPSRTAIGVDRHGVGIDTTYPQMKVGRLVEAGDGLRIGVAGNARREIAQIRPERRQRVDLHRNDASMAIEAHASGGVVIARLRVGEKGFGSRGGPLDRPA